MVFMLQLGVGIIYIKMYYRGPTILLAYWHWNDKNLRYTTDTKTLFIIIHFSMEICPTFNLYIWIIIGGLSFNVSKYHALGYCTSPCVFNRHKNV